jgi:PilZ domain-containing protein
VTNAVLLRNVPLVLRDVSSGGCSIESRTSLHVGMVGWLEVEFEGERRYEWFRIARIHRSSDDIFLAGVEFLTLSAAGSDSLRRAIGRLRHAPQASPEGAGRSSGDLGNSDGRSDAAAAAAPAETASSTGKIIDFVRRS